MSTCFAFCSFIRTFGLSPDEVTESTSVLFVFSPLREFSDKIKSA